jgi:glycerate kinase
MKILAAPQALKGSLSAAVVGAAIQRGIHTVAPTAEVAILPIADGGEGTVEALVAATGGRLLSAPVIGPLGESVTATFGMLGRRHVDHEVTVDDVPTAIIEMASASGLTLLPSLRLDPRVATTYGTGELIRAALDVGARRLLIGIGGSATNDGGAGMAQALGARLLDAEGHDLSPGGAALARLDRIEVGGLDPRLAKTEVVVACDVSNPLCGPHGASAVYGPQKGATPEMVAALDAALDHYARILARDLGMDVAERPGAGAAGGLGAGLMAFLHATPQPGADMVLRAIGFADHLRGAALVFTAEGRLDGQTAYGKSVAAVARAGQDQGTPVIVLGGALGAGYEALYDLGVCAALPLADGPLTLDESMTRAEELVAGAAERAMRLVLIGTTLRTL